MSDLGQEHPASADPSEPPDDWYDPEEPTQNLPSPDPPTDASPAEEHRPAPEVRIWEHERLSDIAAVILEELGKEHVLLRRGGSVVAVRGWDPDAGPKRTAAGSDGVSRPTVAIQRDAPVIRQLAGGALDYEVDRHMAFYTRRVTKDGEEAIKRVPCPGRVLSMVSGVGGDRVLAPLDGILRTPSLRADGTILSAPGYDPATGYYLATHERLDGLLSGKPTLDKARKALAALQDLFAPSMPDRAGGTVYGFPWKRGMSETIVPIALALTLFARPALVCVPAFAIDASTPGSGKGLAIGVCSVLATGEEPARGGWPSTPEEQQKTLGSYALFSPPLIAWDNVRGKVQNEDLENALTTDRHAFRLLGYHDMKTMPFRSVVTFTGNNISFGGDMPRRVMVGRLEPDTEHPDRIPKDCFRHPNIMAHVRAKRSYYAAAILCILRAYFLAGMPDQGLTLGSFSTESGGLGWIDLVGGALAWVGAGNITDFSAKESVEEPEEWQFVRTLLAAWHRIDPDHNGITLSSLLALLYPQEVVELIRKGAPVPPTLGDWTAERSAIQGLSRTRDRDVPDSAKVGIALRPFKGRWFQAGGRERRFVHALGGDGKPSRPARWRIEER